MPPGWVGQSTQYYTGAIYEERLRQATLAQHTLAYPAHVIARYKPSAEVLRIDEEIQRRFL